MNKLSLSKIAIFALLLFSYRLSAAVVNVDIWPGVPVTCGSSQYTLLGNGVDDDTIAFNSILVFYQNAISYPDGSAIHLHAGAYALRGGVLCLEINRSLVMGIRLLDLLPT